MYRAFRVKQSLPDNHPAAQLARGEAGLRATEIECLALARGGELRRRLLERIKAPELGLFGAGRAQGRKDAASGLQGDNAGCKGVRSVPAKARERKVAHFSPPRVARAKDRSPCFCAARSRKSGFCPLSRSGVVL